MNPPDLTHRFVVRLPMHIRNRIVGAAKYHRRSMNSEIVTRLDQSFSGPADQEPRSPLLDCPIAEPLGNEREVQLLQCYRALPAAQREALLALLIR
ncbi:MAG: Arc family DNA-binding protein [Pseudomonadota bacterium]